MKVELIPDSSRTDGGGTMRVTATTPADKGKVLEHFNRFSHNLGVVEQAQIITSPDPYVLDHTGGTRDNGAYFAVAGSLDIEWTEPYFRELNRRTGFVGRGILPDISAEEMNYKPLCYTHYGTEVSLDQGHLCFDVLVHGQDWNGRTALEHAQRYAEDRMKRAIGNEPLVPEFLENGNGSYRRNPKYATGNNPVHPACKAQWLWDALIDWWLLNEATQGQCEASMASLNLHSNGIGDLRKLNSYRGIHTTWEKDGYFTWEEFAKL